jgi:hypothetical protein
MMEESMGTLLQDVRFGLRMLARTPGFTVVVAITLALGIGANSTIFSWISSTLLDPVPGVADTSRLISVMKGERSEHPTPPFSIRTTLTCGHELRAFRECWRTTTISFL